MNKLIVSSDRTIYELTEKELSNTDKILTLIRSEYDSKWTKPGSKCMELHDNGNGLKLRSEGTPFKVKLEYSEACELYILLHEYFQANPDTRVEYKVYREE